MGRNVFNVIIDRVVSAVRVKLTDPTDTNTAAVDASGNVSVKLAAGANTAGSVKVTDGANFLPTGDAAARAVCVKVTDGTNTLALTKKDLTTNAAWALPVVGWYGPSNADYALTMCASSTDGQSVASPLNIALLTQARLWGFNGTGFDRLRSVNTGQLVVTPKDAAGNTHPAMDTRARKGFAMDCPDSVVMGSFNHGTVTANWTLNAAAGVAQSASYDLYLTALSVNCVNNPVDAPIVVGVWDGTRWLAWVSGALWNNTHFTFPKPLRIPAGNTWYTGFYLGGANNYGITVYYSGYQIATTL